MIFPFQKWDSLVSWRVIVDIDLKLKIMSMFAMFKVPKMESLLDPAMFASQEISSSQKN